VKPAALALCVVFAGCATLFAGGPDRVPINTNPPGAYVYVNGQVVGQTPMIVNLDRHMPEAQIQIALPGFRPIVIVRDKGLNVWTLANILIGVLPIVIDFITADFQEYDSSPIVFGLTPAGPNDPPPPPMVPQQQQPYPPPPPPPSQ
jgi:hypothetical protein